MRIFAATTCNSHPYQSDVGYVRRRRTQTETLPYDSVFFVHRRPSQKRAILSGASACPPGATTDTYPRKSSSLNLQPRMYDFGASSR